MTITTANGEHTLNLYIVEEGQVSMDLLSSVVFGELLSRIDLTIAQFDDLLACVGNAINRFNAGLENDYFGGDPLKRSIRLYLDGVKYA